MVEFGGYELPVQYTSIRAEHRAVREAAGLFDVSHMGQIEFEGPDAIAAADGLFSRNLAGLEPGQIQYGLLCNESGGVVDDITCYRVAEQSAFWCVNASNIEKDWDWILDHAGSSRQRRTYSPPRTAASLSDFVLDRSGSRSGGSTVVWIRRGIPEVVDRRLRVDHPRILVVAEQHNQSGASCATDGRHSME